MSRPRVVIIGAGLGGLCLAQGLHKAGIEVAVYERDSAIEARIQGYRVHLDTRGTEPLHACLPAALYELFEATHGQSSTGLTTCRVDGTSLTRLQTGHFFPSGQTNTMIQIGWATDRLTLRQTLLAGLDGLVYFGKEFTGYEVLAGGEVAASFADGSKTTGDLLIGADGVNSRVRRQLLPQTAVVDTGNRWLGGRTLLDAPIRDAVLSEEFPDHAVLVHGNGTSMFLAPLLFRQTPDDAARRLWPGLRFTHNQNYLMWAIVGGSDEMPAPDDELCKMSAVQLYDIARDATANGQAALTSIVRSAQPDETFYLKIRAAASVEHWSTGPVTLLGDAIHASEVNGNGANGALRDAGILHRQLIGVAQRGVPLLRALHDYEREMLRNARTAREAIRESPVHQVARSANGVANPQ